MFKEQIRSVNEAKGLRNDENETIDTTSIDATLSSQQSVLFTLYTHPNFIPEKLLCGFSTAFALREDNGAGGLSETGTRPVLTSSCCCPNFNGSIVGSGATALGFMFIVYCSR